MIARLNGPVAAWFWRVGLVIVLAAGPCLVAQRGLAQTTTPREFQLRYAPPEQVEPVLHQLLSPSARVTVDAQNRRILIAGTEQDLQVASSVIRALDQPQRSPQQPPHNPIPVVKSYPLPQGNVEAVASQLRARYAGRQDVRITVDNRTSQLLVVAPEDVQMAIGGLVMEQRPSQPTFSGMTNPVRVLPVGTETPTAGSQPSLTPPGRSTPPANMASAAGPAGGENSTQRLPASGGMQITEDAPLWNAQVGQVEAFLKETLGPALEPVLVPGATQPSGYQITLRTGEKLSLSFDRQANRIQVRGPAWAMPAARQLIHALDGPPNTETRTVRLVPLSATKAESVQQLTRAVRVANTTASEAEAENIGTNLLAQVEQPENQEQSQPPQPAQEQASQQPPAEGQPQPPAPGEQQAPGAETPAGEGGLIGPVQIEYLEGLDVLVIRGNRRDVERVMQIIRQIEELSVETEPEIRVVLLRHVDCEALLTILNQVYQAVYAARRGPITMIALVKPNAILLVGRQEAVRTVLELIGKLDRPVSPETEFKVFPLKHASATTVEQRLTTFYQNRGGLGTRILITSDFRSNTVIVKASPRDMLEIEQMIAKLDVPTSEAVNEIRVFTLKNSLASELATVLQQAISATGAAGAVRQTATGQVTTAQAAGQQQEVRSTRLRFLTVDTQGKQMLESGIVTDVRITADVRANALVVSAPSDSMPLIAALVAELDRLPSAEAQVKVFTIVNGDAQALADMLQTLFGQTVTVAGGAAGAAAQPAYRTGAQEGESSLIPLRFAVDVRTNSIIASGSAGDLAVVEAILLRLDESEIIKRKTEVFRLKNAPANDVASAINTYLTNERQVRQLNVNAFSTFEFLSKEVVIVPEPVSNSLIVSATPEYYDQIVEIITRLDERPPMVLIQVLIAEVQLSNTDEFGIELGIQDPILFNRSVAGVPGFLFNSTGPLGNNTSAPSPDVVGAQAISNFGVGRGNSTLGFGGMVLSASSEAVSVLIRALRQQRRLDVLSRPQVMALDNQPAFVQVGQQVPTITGTSVTQNVQVNSVSFTNTGLILLVRPRISPDGQVVMEINAEKSDVGPESEGIPISVSASGQVIRSPRINTTRAQTTVSAADGQTIILAGLITKSRSVTNRRIPGLSDIPILRHFFRYDIDESSRSELLIILTPHVVRSEEDIERVKQIEAARMHWCLADVVALHDGMAPPATGNVEQGPMPTPATPGTEGREVIPTPTPSGTQPAQPMNDTQSQFGPSPILGAPVATPGYGTPTDQVGVTHVSDSVPADPSNPFRQETAAPHNVPGARPLGSTPGR